MRRLLSRALNGAGHTVHEASDGRGALEAYYRLRPALVITDIVMPDKEGIELIQELRRTDPAIAILAISGGASRSVYLKAASALGATAALSKPFSIADLLTTVATLLHDPARSSE